MLEFWYRENRTLIDFRRGPLGPHFDAFAAALKSRGYSQAGAVSILSKCCQWNGFLIDQGVTRASQINEALVDSFLDLYTKGFRTTACYSPRAQARASLMRLYSFLLEIHACRPPPRQKPKPTLYGWLVDPYLRYLAKDCQLANSTIHRLGTHARAFLAALGQEARRPRLKALQSEKFELHLRQYLKDSPENLAALTGSLRRLLRFCAARHFTRTDYSLLVPSAPQYRHASLPKGIEDSALEKALKSIDTETLIGARDYAIFVLMMAYGIRGISVAQLLLDDLDWPHSRIRIRAQKGGKEVILPLMEPAGEALIRYLRHRAGGTPFREIFLTTKAPFTPITSLVISRIVRNYLKRAGIQVPGTGSRTLRHSWAIRALAHDTPIKSIADILGHRYIDTTFIYAKADLNSLREVAMPWPRRS